MEEPVLSDEFKDSCWIGDKEFIFGILLEDESESLLLLLLVVGG